MRYRYFQELSQSSYTRYKISRDQLAVSNDTVARCLLQCFLALNLFQAKPPRIPRNFKISFAATCFAALRILCSVSAIKQACRCFLLQMFALSLAGTLKPTKISDAFDTGPPVVSRVIAIDNAMLRQQFKAAMDRMEAKGGRAWDSNPDLQVLRMSVPNIAEYFPLPHYCSFLSANRFLYLRSL